MAKHGIFITEKGTSVSTPVVAESGIPFVIGTAPVHSAETPAKLNTPVLCTSWSEAVEKFGYSDDWTKYSLCEFMYSHFQLYHRQPVVLCNVLDITSATNKSSTSASSMTVEDHKVVLPIDVVNDNSLIVKLTSEGEALAKGTDYAVFYDEDHCIVELLSDGSAYSATSLILSYDSITGAGVSATTITTNLEALELCMTKLGIIPDLIVAPGWSETPAVAIAMATKAASINGLFTSKAIVDISSASGAAQTYTDAVSYKSTNLLTDDDMIVCWPKAKLGDKVFHLSTLLAGTIAAVDAEHDGVPYASPSNHTIMCDALCIAGGTEYDLTFTMANVLNNAGIVTALNFINGWSAWGNYTACYPANTDVKDYFIPISRMFTWVGNSIVKTFWSKLDVPMNRRLIENIMDTCNIWLNGLVGQGCLLGARVAILKDENPDTNLIAGIIKVHVYITPPSPAQEIDFVLEYDANYVAAALL